MALDQPALWIRTVSGTQNIDDLGITIGTTGRELTAEFSYDELTISDDLLALVGDGNIEWSETGSVWTLSDQDVQDILSTYTKEDHDDMSSGNPHNVSANEIGADNIVTEVNTNATTRIDESKLDSDLVNTTALGTAIDNHHAPTSVDHDDRYRTESELSTPNTGNLVDWTNVANKPPLTLGAYNPVWCRVLQMNAGTPPAGNDGDFYLDNSSTPKLYKMISSSWTYQFDVTTAPASPNTDPKSRYINLADGDESVYEWGGSSYTDGGLAENGFEINVRDDGDGKQAVYIYQLSSTEWRKIADVDWGVHHLDDAYDDSPSANKTINVDDGSVDLNQNDSYSPLVINEKDAKPSNNPGSGKTGLISVADQWYGWDDSRSKWLSVERITLRFGVGNNSLKARYLPLFGEVPSLKSSGTLRRNATLIEVSVDTGSTHSCDYKVAKKSNPTSYLHTFNITSGSDDFEIDVDVDFNSGDKPILHMVPVGANKVDYPVVELVFAYRL